MYGSQYFSMNPGTSNQIQSTVAGAVSDISAVAAAGGGLIGESGTSGLLDIATLGQATVEAFGERSQTALLAGELAALPSVAMNQTRLACKRRLLQAMEQRDDVDTATRYWFSAETQAAMRRLAERLVGD